MYTEKEFEEHVEFAKRILKDTYVNNIVYVQERIRDGAEESEIEQIEELILANERMIIYYDKGDKWVKDLHEEAQRNSKEGGDEPAEGSRYLGDEGDAIEAEFEEEFARIEAARNS